MVSTWTSCDGRLISSDTGGDSVPDDVEVGSTSAFWLNALTGKKNSPPTTIEMAAVEFGPERIFNGRRIKGAILGHLLAASKANHSVNDGSEKKVVGIRQRKEKRLWIRVKFRLLGAARLPDLSYKY